MKHKFLSVIILIIVSETLAQDFYLAPNGVTCMCPNATVGSSGDPGNGIVYTKRTAPEITPQNAASTCTSGITDMSELFMDEPDFNEDISTWDVSSVLSMASMFNNYGVGGNSIFNADLSFWDVSNVNNMNSMFQDCYAFNSDIGNWNVSNVTDMAVMFEFALSFNQNLSDWNVSNVTSMRRMFSGAESFNQPIGSWDVSNVTSFSDMFYGYNGMMMFDQDISSWEFNPSIISIGFNRFLDKSGMGIENYDLLIESIFNQNISSYSFGADELIYCDSGNHRQALISEGWTFNGDAPKDIILNAPPDLILSCQGINVDLGQPVTDACGEFNISNDAPTQFPLGNTLVNWTVIDENGSERTDSQNVELLYLTDEAQICYVTSDWNNPIKNRVWITSDPNLNGQNVDYHKVLRESSAGMFEPIGFIFPPNDSFLDTSSDNSTQAYRYKVQTTDLCGQELNLSAYHKTILLQSSIATDNSVNLSWNPYFGLSFNTYNIYRSINGAAYELLTSLAASNLTYNDTSANVMDNFYEYFVSIDVSSCSALPLQPLSLRSNQEYVNPNLVIKDNDWLNKAIIIYPNPASEAIKISMTEDLELEQIMIYNTLGQRLMMSNQYEINVSNLPAGIYYLSIKTNQGIAKKTLVRN